MHGSLVLLPVVLGACFTKPDPPGTGTDASTNDSQDASATCFLDSFDSGTGACLPWGHGYGNGDSESIGGDLVLTPQANTQRSDAGCRTSGQVPFVDGGTYIEVLEVVSAPAGYTSLTLDDGNRYPQIVQKDGALKFATLSGAFVSRPYVAADMRWWRLRPDLPRDKIVAEYSADGVAWVTLGELNNAPATARPSIEAGVLSSEVSPGMARVAQFYLCP